MTKKREFCQADQFSEARTFYVVQDSDNFYIRGDGQQSLHPDLFTSRSEANRALSIYVEATRLSLPPRPILRVVPVSLMAAMT
ncbi:MAG: hypothetical protein ROR55_19810 [Devosia sp.]